MRYRTVQSDNGTSETLVILDEPTLHRWSSTNPLAFERSIIWLLPVQAIDFARVALVRDARSRLRPIPWSEEDLVVGYSTLTDDAPLDSLTKAYARRIFYLKPTDLYLNMNQFPRDAVDPSTVLPGVAGDPPNLAIVDRGYPLSVKRATTPTPRVASGTAIAPRPVVVCA